MFGWCRTAPCQHSDVPTLAPAAGGPEVRTWGDWEEWDGTESPPKKAPEKEPTEVKQKDEHCLLTHFPKDPKM